MGDGTALFDVGVVALAHAGTPVSERALDPLREAIRGERDAVIPYAAPIGAHHVLTSYYGFSNEHAADLMTNLMDARRIRWYDELPERVVREGFDLAATLDVEAWDGYYAQVAHETDADVILTLDRDFETVDGVTAEVVLSQAEFATLDDHLG